MSVTFITNDVFRSACDEVANAIQNALPDVNVTLDVHETMAHVRLSNDERHLFVDFDHGTLVVHKAFIPRFLVAKWKKQYGGAV